MCIRDRKSSVPLSLEVLNMICKKSRLHRAWIRSQNEDNCRAAYAKVCNKVKKEICKTKRKFEKDVATKASISPKSFWYHMRRQLKSKESVAPLYEHPDDKLSIKHSDKEKANILQKQFSSVFTINFQGSILEQHPLFLKSISQLKWSPKRSKHLTKTKQVV